jgi:hypothetical protein
LAGTQHVSAPARSPRRPVAGKREGRSWGVALILSRSSKRNSREPGNSPFASQAEQQAAWYADTGYFPTRLSAYDLETAQERQQPAVKTAVDQVRSPPDLAATSALIGAFNQCAAALDAPERALELEPIRSAR